MEALQQPSIRVIAVIAEGVPEGDTKQLIAYAAKHNKIVLGPATVGGLQVQLTCSPCDHCKTQTCLLSCQHSAVHHLIGLLWAGTYSFSSYVSSMLGSLCCNCSQHEGKAVDECYACIDQQAFLQW